MTEIFGNVLGETPEPTGLITADLGEFIAGLVDGDVPEPEGLVLGAVVSGGDRTEFVTVHEASLSGLKFFTKGPGYLIAGAGESSQKVVLIDATGFRSMRVESESIELDGNIEALVSSESYVFAYTIGKHVLDRRVYVLENAPGLAVVTVFDLGNAELSAWLAIKEDVGVVAFPVGVGRVQVRNIAAPFDIIGEAPSVGRSALGLWVEIPDITLSTSLVMNINKKSYLYVIAGSDGDGKAAAISYDVDAQAINKVGDVHFPDAQDPVRFDTQGCSVVTRAAITPQFPVTPIFRGSFQVGKGVFATVWGYDNQNAFIVDQPVRSTGLTRNHLVSAPVYTQDVLPVLFAAGDIEVAFIIFTQGESISWELQPQSGGGFAVSDYSVELDPSLLTTLSAFIVRQQNPAFLRYQTFEVLNVTKVVQERFGNIELNNAGLSFDSTTLIRHTEAFNDDIAGQSEWYGRDAACRMEGGAIQAHARVGRASRILNPGLGRELARGQQFVLQTFHVEEAPPAQPPEVDAQAGERLGRLTSVSEEGIFISSAAELYSDGTYSVGRVAIFRYIESENDAIFVNWAYLPPDWTAENNVRFGRFNELHPDGTLLFAAGKRGPGVAVFNLDSVGNPTYWKTLVWTGYTAIPEGEKGNEARVSRDGNTLIMACGGFSTGTQPSHSFVLQTDDHWETFTVVQDIVKPGAPTNNPMNTMDVSRDFSSFVVANWIQNEIYVFRTTDNWQTYSTYALPNPAEYPFGSSSGDLFGNPVACSYDGFRIYAGAPFGSADYGSGIGVNNGSVEIYEFDVVADAYVHDRRLTPPVTLPDSALFGSVVSNYPGSRFRVLAGGLNTHFLYGINGDDITMLRASTANGGGLGRFFAETDTIANGESSASNGAKALAGSMNLVRYSEEP